MKLNIRPLLLLKEVNSFLERKGDSYTWDELILLSTCSIEVLQCIVSLAMVDHIASREQGESVEQLEDGVARLVDRHDHNMVTLHAQPAERNIKIKSQLF